MMKKLYAFLFLPYLLTTILLGASCDKNDDQPVDQLPPATTFGANTFGCLVNGEPWLPKSDVWWDSAISAWHAQWPTGEWHLKVGVTRYRNGTHQNFNINVWDPVLGENSISFSEGIFSDFSIRGCDYQYYLDTLSPHIMLVTKLDDVNFIASGTFSFIAINDDCLDTIRVTEGRFDVDSHL